MSNFVIRDFVGSFPLRFLVQNPWVDPATGEAGCDSLGTIEVDGVEAVVVFTDDRWARRFLTATGFNRLGGEIGRFDQPEQMIDFLNARRDSVTHLTFDPKPGVARTPFPLAECIAAFEADVPEAIPVISSESTGRTSGR
jgi:hypothetical protein